MIAGVLVILGAALIGLGLPPWLVAVILALVYLGDLYVHPSKPCPRCQRREVPGTNRGSRRSAFGRCNRCDSARPVPRIGSRQLHRAVRSLADARTNRKENKP
jgi:hypothetical protein